ncbi:MAG: DMT family transporter [Candidatus Micrarchaeaceae archaeon]
MEALIKSLVYLFISLLILASLPIFLYLGGRSSGTVPFLFFTFLFSSIISSLALFKNRKKVKANLKWRELTMISLAGVLNFAVAGLLLTIGELHTGVNLAYVVSRSWPLMTIPLITLLLGNRVSARRLFVSLISFIAFSFTILYGVNIQASKYLVLVFLSAFFTAISNVLAKKVNVNIIVQLCLFNIFSLLFISFFLPFYHITLSSTFLLEAFTTALFAYFIAGFFYFYALKGLDPSFVGNIMLISPFITFALSSIFLKEAVSLQDVLGGAIVIIGNIFGLIVENPSAMKRRRSNYFDVTGIMAYSKHPLISSKLYGNARAIATGIEREIELLKEEVKEIENKFGVLILLSSYEIPKEEKEEISNILGTNSFILGVGEPNKVEAALDSIVYQNPKNSAKNFQSMKDI